MNEKYGWFVWKPVFVMEFKKIIKNVISTFYLTIGTFFLKLFSWIFLRNSFLFAIPSLFNSIQLITCFSQNWEVNSQFWEETVTILGYKLRDIISEFGHFYSNVFFPYHFFYKSLIATFCFTNLFFFWWIACLCHSSEFISHIYWDYMYSEWQEIKSELWD